MPIAAKMASSSVGGSRRTRRGPYLVFQSWLIGASLVIPNLRCPHIALQYEIDMAVQPCILTRSRLVGAVFPGNRLPPPSNGPRNDRKICRLLRPAPQRGMSGIGQKITAALGAIDPAINIVQQNFRASGIAGLRSRTRCGPRCSADAQANACWRYAVMIGARVLDRKSTRLNSSHPSISYAVFCLKKKKKKGKNESKSE